MVTFRPRENEKKKYQPNANRERKLTDGVLIEALVHLVKEGDVVQAAKLVKCLNDMDCA